MSNEHLNELRILDREIWNRYYRIQYLLVQAGDRPDIGDVHEARVFETLDGARAARARRIQPDDWQIIQVGMSPVDA